MDPELAQVANTKYAIALMLDGFLPQNFGRWWGPTNH